MTIAALEAGKHVLCEKPMATSLQDAERMIEAAEKFDKQLMIAHNQRLEPANQNPGSEYWAIDGADTWFYRKNITGLGVLGDLAIHKLDLVRWILADDYSEAFALLDTLSKTSYSTPLAKHIPMVVLLMWKIMLYACCGRKKVQWEP